MASGVYMCRIQDCGHHLMISFGPDFHVPVLHARCDHGNTEHKMK